MAPKELDGEALEKWDELVQRLSARRIVTPDDAEALAVACVHWEIAWQARREIVRRGVMLKRSKNPACQVWRDASTSFITIISRFGLTPLDRDRIRPAEEPEEVDIFP